jgi:zinc protease
MTRENPSNDVLKKILPNGLTVLLREDRSNPVVAINVWFGIGSAHETEDAGGLSHFQEHMVFKGTEKYGVSGIPDAVKSAGGSLNAGTSYSYTMYHVVMPSRSFALGLEVQADAMMNSTFDPDEFRKERLVVIDEARMYDDTPDAFTYYRAMELGFAAHNYRRPIAGYESVVSAFTREQLVDFYRAHYRPGNAILVVVGDVEREQAVREIERVYGGWKGERRAPLDSPAEPPQEAFRFKTYRGSIDHAYLRFGFHASSILDPEYPALEVLANLLGSGRSSRLYQRIREEKKLVTSASADLLAERWPGYFMVSASTPADKWEAARDAVFEEIARFARDPVSEEELLKARRQVEKAMYSELETMEGQASNLGYYEVLGDYRLADEHREAVRRVTAGEIMSAARKYLHLKNCSFVAYLPETERIAAPSLEAVKTALRSVEGKTAIRAVEKKTAIQAVEKKTVVAAPNALREGAAGTAPSSVRARRETAPEAERRDTTTHRVVLSNGVRVLCRSRATVPMVTALAISQGGTRLEARGKSGLSLLSTRVLLKGTDAYSSDEIVGIVERLGGTIDSFSGFDVTGVYVNILSDHLDEALAVLKDVLRRPRFAQDKVEEEKKRLLEELAKRRDHPVYYSIDHLFSRLFGNHPYAHPFIGDESQLRGLGPADCAEQHRRCLDPDAAVMVFVGDIDETHAREAAEMLFGDLAPVRPVPVTVEPCDEPAYPGFHELRREKLHQAVGLVGFLAPPMLTKEAASLRVLDGLMTGLGGRLFVELRDKRSLGYMTGSAFMPLKERSIFYGYANPKPEGLQEAVDVILAELDRVTREPVTDEELARSREWLAGTHAMKLQRNLAQAIDYGYYEALGYGYGTVDRMVGMIRDVTKEDIRRAAAAVFDPNKAVCVRLIPQE